MIRGRRTRRGRLILIVAGDCRALLAGTRYANYARHLIASAMLLVSTAMAWDILNGYVGIFSFGHAAFSGRRVRGRHPDRPAGITRPRSSCSPPSPSRRWSGSGWGSSARVWDPWPSSW